MRKITSKSLGLGLGLALMVGSVTTTSASTITWIQPSTDLFAGGDNGNFVDNTTGSLVLAFNGTDGAGTAVDGTTVTTVNGVGFQHVDVDNLNSGAVTGVGGVGVSSTYVSGRETATAFNSGSFTDAGVVSLIEGAVFGGGTGAPTTPSLTFSNLTIGDDYFIQVLLNDARTNGTRDSDWQTGFSDGVNNDIGGGADTRVAFANLNNRDPVTLVGELSGDYITGTFTAMTTTQTFALDGTRDGASTFSAGQAQINALQLRTIPAAIPEPSSLALLGLGGLFLANRRRR